MIATQLGLQRSGELAARPPQHQDGRRLSPQMYITTRLEKFGIVQLLECLLAVFRTTPPAGLPSPICCLDARAASISVNDYTIRMNINSAGLFFEDTSRCCPISRLTWNAMEWDVRTRGEQPVLQLQSNLVNKTTGNLGDVQFAGQNGALRTYAEYLSRFLPRVGYSWNFAKHTCCAAATGFIPPEHRLLERGRYSKYSLLPIREPRPERDAPVRAEGRHAAYSYNIDANGNANIPASLTKPSSK